MTTKTLDEIKQKHEGADALAPGLAAAIMAKVGEKNLMACKVAHKVAEDQGISPSLVGKALDQLGVRMMGCQLGLFGPKRLGQAPALTDPELRSALKSCVNEGRALCADIWRKADELGLSRVEAARTLDDMGVKIKGCQLGAF